MRFVSLLLASAALAACEQTNTAASDINATSNAVESGEASAIDNAAATTTTSCVAGLKSVVDKGSFEGMGEAPSAEKLETLRTKADLLFRDVANRMCAANELKSEEIGVFNQLLIQNGGGADNTAIYGDSEIHGRYTLVFQYAFGGEELGLPVPDDVREGLLCHFGDEEKYREMCKARLP